MQAGRGSSLTARLAAAPIVAGGHVFVTDTLGTVRAFDARTGAQLWASQTPTEKGDEKSIYGGGIAYDQGRDLRHQRPRLSSLRSTSATAASSGRCGPADRCAARRRSPTAPST